MSLLDFVVIGAGASGLAAARGLSEAGLTGVVLEARARIGGRVYTIHDRAWPLPLELGAEFLHGDADDTQAIARASGLLVDELPERHVWAKGGRWRPLSNTWPRFAAICRKIPTRGVDRSFAAFLASRRSLSRESSVLARMLVEGYHAAPADDVSARSLAAEDDDLDPRRHRQHRLPGGYDAIISTLHSSLDDRVTLRLNTPVSLVEWSAGRVRVHAPAVTGARVKPVEARAAVITLPVGALKAGPGLAGGVRFEPSLRAKERALGRFAEAPVQKIVLRFREAFWQEDAFVAKRARAAEADPQYFHDPRAAFPTWWTPAPARAPLLTGWAGGPAALRLTGQSDRAVLSAALDTLARILAVPRSLLDEQLDGAARHDWHADPWSRGAYSYLKIGGAGAPLSLARPLRNTLFFAGEATSDAESGTVSGAIASGTRAAREVASALGARS